MSAPNINTKAVSFSRRLDVVAVEINKRLAKVEPKQRAALLARLWCGWLVREVI